MSKYLKTEFYRDTYLVNKQTENNIMEATSLERLETNYESDSDSSLSDVSLDICNAPLTRVFRGRPSKKRKRKNDIRIRGKKQNMMAEPVTGGPPGTVAPDRAPPKCKTCSSIGHYAKTCKNAHS